MTLLQKVCTRQNLLLIATLEARYFICVRVCMCVCVCVYVWVCVCVCVFAHKLYHDSILSYVMW